MSNPSTIQLLTDELRAKVGGMRVVMVIVVLAWSATALAKDLTISKGAITITIPDSWKIEAHGPGALIAGDVNEAFVTVYVSQLESEPDALRWCDDHLAKEYKSPGRLTRQRFNSMDVWLAERPGMMDRDKIEFAAVLVRSPSNKFVFAIAITPRGKYKTHRKTIREMLESLRPSLAKP